MKKTWIVMGLLTLVAGVQAPLAQADGVRRFHREGPNGGEVVGRRALRGDGAGNGLVSSAGAARTPNGGLAARAGMTTRAADGSIEHRSALAASSDKGSVQSGGSASRDANGNLTQQRDTTLTNAANGNSYQGNTSYSTQNGLSHSGSCYDAAGAVIACPSR